MRLETLLRGLVIGFSIAAPVALRSRLDLASLRWVNRVSGAALLAFGVAALAWR